MLVRVTYGWYLRFFFGLFQHARKSIVVIVKSRITNSTLFNYFLTDMTGLTKQNWPLMKIFQFHISYPIWMKSGLGVHNRQNWHYFLLDPRAELLLGLNGLVPSTILLSVIPAFLQLTPISLSLLLLLIPCSSSSELKDFFPVGESHLLWDMIYWYMMIYWVNFDE